MNGEKKLCLEIEKHQNGFHSESRVFTNRIYEKILFDSYSIENVYSGQWKET